MVQEYERAVIFRLGRLPAGGSKGPGRESEGVFLEDVILPGTVWSSNLPRSE